MRRGQPATLTTGQTTAITRENEQQGGTHHRP
jgi:hypothetical protein